jgi:3-oxoacyl-[acyl-carrier-protein] synthase III
VIGIRGIACHYDETVPIETLPRLAEDALLLKKFQACGHGTYARAQVGIVEQTVLAARKTLERSGLDAQNIDAVVIGTSELRDWNRYPEQLANEVLLALGIRDVLVVGVTLAGCANYASALRMARNLIAVEGCRNVLVIETNQVRGNLERVYAPGHRAAFIFGDAALSYIATPDAADFKVFGMEQLVRPINDAIADSAAYIANNVGGFRHVTERALALSGVTRAQLGKVFMHNMNWHVLITLLQALDIPRELLYGRNIRRTAHLWGADNLIGLHDYCAEESPPAGALFLLLCQADTYFSAVVCQKQ